MDLFKTLIMQGVVCVAVVLILMETFSYAEEIKMMHSAEESAPQMDMTRFLTPISYTTSASSVYIAN
jgi:hypothetical protein